MENLRCRGFKGKHFVTEMFVTCEHMGISGCCLHVCMQSLVTAGNTFVFADYKVWSVRGIFRGLIGGGYSGYEGFL